MTISTTEVSVLAKLIRQVVHTIGPELSQIRLYKEFTDTICDTIDKYPAFNTSNILMVKRKIIAVLWMLESRGQSVGHNNHVIALKAAGWSVMENYKAVLALQDSYGDTSGLCVEKLVEVLNKEVIMDNNKAFESIDYVYGTDITTMSTAQLIAAIKKAEGERNALDGVKTPSKKVKAMQADLDDSIAKIVAVLDAKP